MPATGPFGAPSPFFRMSQRMEELFEEALALCLDRVADGDSPGSCADDFPELHGLLPLLQVAAALIALRRVQTERRWLSTSGVRPFNPSRDLGGRPEERSPLPPDTA